MEKPKLILLYGFASSGKTTLSEKYLSEHPLTISIEGDQIISMIGQWRNHENEARTIVFEDTTAMAKVHLNRGYDVLLPYLLTDHTQAEVFEEIAREMSADFCEVYIKMERKNAINRLLNRGVWGEVGSPQLTESDTPEMNKLYDAMESAMTNRKPVKIIPSHLDDVDGTYAAFIDALS